MGLEIEGLDELASSLTVASDALMPEVEKVVKHGLQNVKTDTAKLWRQGWPHLPHLARSVDYDDPVRDGDTVWGEVGPNAAKLQGGLAPYIERGTATSRPHPALRPAADAEGPRLVDALADRAVDLLRR